MVEVVSLVVSWWGGYLEVGCSSVTGQMVVEMGMVTVVT
jgi:hypothetical protein